MAEGNQEQQEQQQQQQQQQQQRQQIRLIDRLPRRIGEAIDSDLFQIFYDQECWFVMVFISPVYVLFEASLLTLLWLWPPVCHDYRVLFWSSPFIYRYVIAVCIPSLVAWITGQSGRLSWKILLVFAYCLTHLTSIHSLIFLHVEGYPLTRHSCYLTSFIYVLAYVYIGRFWISMAMAWIRKIAKSRQQRWIRLMIDAIPQFTHSETDAPVRCSICLEDFVVGAEGLLTKCEHRYHDPCIREWLLQDPKCPMCRTKLW